MLLYKDNKDKLLLKQVEIHVKQYILLLAQQNAQRQSKPLKRVPKRAYFLYLRL